ncbi:hypothetical protein MAF45_04970 [Mesosutterella sp. OilRF-GAM-744-9]|uniref:Lipoprotein n=1 Tax=Mesosutterella porci TaxID=2915351 RepID=A0ABS9MQI8_9BURK|nr:hypothetical protein [Mesosutterella sp. oilRF-744-WT-GAM-9]MCG5030797.1 hypothetical protein [Mesosutterella sp. oilRF-744-WT-GAM-9]MCI6529493.1 hypothetical protein [Mesosutterella sp.]
MMKPILRVLAGVCLALTLAGCSVFAVNGAAGASGTIHFFAPGGSGPAAGSSR